MTNQFNEMFAQKLETLDMYTVAITRAHGKSHPEAFEVRDLFEQIEKQVAKVKGELPDLKEQFIQLRRVTDDYKVPNDVCETYEGTYNMLAELDKVYHG